VWRRVGIPPPASLKWDSKIWSWVLRDLDRRVTANCRSKLQTRPLVREGIPQHDDRKCPTVIKIWSWDTKTDWPTERRSQNNFNLIFEFHWSMVTDGCLTLRQNDRLTDAYDISLTLEDVTDRHNKGNWSLKGQECIARTVSDLHKNDEWSLWEGWVTFIITLMIVAKTMEIDIRKHVVISRTLMIVIRTPSGLPKNNEWW
jgi:hypothetical protein